MDVLLRIYSSHEEKLEEYLKLLLSYGIRGAVVLQGIGGFGKGREFHTEEIEVLSHQLPVVIEVLEEREKVIKFLEENAEFLKDCFVTLEKVKEWGQL
ncbi:DUF190 domain-containing protein [Aquifex sp.]